MKLKTSLPTLGLMLPALLLAACGGGSFNGDADVSDAAVIATRSPDYSAGAVSLVGVDAPYAARTNEQTSDTADIFVRSGGDHFFVIKRYGFDQVLRYEASTPSTPTWTYSTQDAADGSNDSNPSDLIIASPTQAYLLRYGSGKLWIVNPSATTEANFKVGEIDLSAYDGDGVPEMTAGLIRDGKLYVAMQRLEFFDAVKDSYVAVIDIASNTEVSTAGAAGGLKGIHLPVRNVSSLVSAGSSVLAVAAGGADYNDDFTALIPRYDGGIANINTATATASLVLDDGDGSTHPYGQFTELAVAAGDRAYFIGSTGFGADQTLYRFNPAVTPIAPVIVSGFSSLALGSLAVDPAGKLWVGRTDAAAPGVSILGFSGGTETVAASRVDTVLTPINIDFITVPAE